MLPAGRARAALWGGREGGGTKAACQAFLQAFPNLACFRPSFSKQSFGRFVGFQRVASQKNLNDVSPNFCGSPPPFSRIPAAATPHSAVPRRMRSSTFSASRRFSLQLGERRIHGGAAVRIERILNLADFSVFGKRNPSFLPDGRQPSTVIASAANAPNSRFWSK
jgi:hypothetical protein